jgi:hypothetical protein
MSFSRLLLLFFLSSILKEAKSESVSFDILLFGDKVGKTTITHEKRPDGSDFYVLESKSHAKVLWIERNNYTYYEVTYKDGRLISSSAKESENGELKRWNTVKWDGNEYQVEGYKGKAIFKNVPWCSTVTIFFKIPEKTAKLFYEAEADFSELKETEPGTWQFKSSDGHNNVYHYLDGRIDHVEFHVSFATVKLVLSK